MLVCKKYFKYNNLNKTHVRCCYDICHFVIKKNLEIIMRRKKGFLQWFKNQKLGRKILYTFILASVIPLLVAQILMLYVIVNNMKEKVNTLMVNQLAQISERTNLTLDIYTNLVYQIYADNQIIEGIKSYKAEDSEVKARICPGNL